MGIGVIPRRVQSSRSRRRRKKRGEKQGTKRNAETVETRLNIFRGKVKKKKKRKR